jgi:hypothetical protein
VGYFFVTDTNPFEDRLQEILAKYQDPRLVYTPIPPPHRVPVSNSRNVQCTETVRCS